MATDPILMWNEVALEANRVSHTDLEGEQVGPPRSARALAIVHLAMYDAYAGVVNVGKVPGDAGFLPPYLPTPMPAPLPLVAPNASAAEVAAATASMAAAAVAAAAHSTLSSLFPSQAAAFNVALASSDGSSAGRSFGVAVAQALLMNRKDDPGVDSVGYVPSSERGRHRVDPDEPNEGFHAPFYGARSKGFGITKRFGLNPPPLDDQNGSYLRALRQVRGKGIKPEQEGTLPLNDPALPGIERRFPDETLAGIFWGYDGARELGTPPRLYNQVVRRVAIAKNNTIAQNARLFALVNAAMADAGILAWDQKYIHDFWRPVLGIREHDPAAGPAWPPGTNPISPDADPFWLPLGAPNTNATLPAVDRAASSASSIMLDANPNVPNVPNAMGRDTTPNFPAYPSGHATFGAAALHIVRLFYGPGGLDKGGVAECDHANDAVFTGKDGDALDLVSDEFNGINRDSRGTVRPRYRRSFPGGLWQMIVENGRSRVWLGVHWVFDAFAVDADDIPDFDANFGGVPLGLAIAEDIFEAAQNPNWQATAIGPRTGPASEPSAPCNPAAQRRPRPHRPAKKSRQRKPAE